MSFRILIHFLMHQDVVESRYYEMLGRQFRFHIHVLYVLKTRRRSLEMENY